MSTYEDKSSKTDRTSGAATTSGPSPGKRTLVEQAYGSAGVVQRHAAGTGDAAGARKTVSGQQMFGKIDAQVLPDTSKLGTKVTEAVKQDANNIHVQSRGIRMFGDVRLKPDVNPAEEPVLVGWVQTVESSRRVGVYSKAGQVVHKDITAFDKTRDSKGAPEPFYDQPETITRASPSRSAFPVAVDQPNFTLPVKNNDADLTAVEGADSFTVSLEAGPAGKLERLKSHAWQAPWSLTIAPDGTGKGGDLSVAPATTHVEPAPGGPVANKAGNDANNRLTRTFETEAAAIEGLGAMGYQAFLNQMPQHKQLEPSSYWNMVSALWKTNKMVRAKVTWLGDSTDLEISFKADKTVQFPRSDEAREVSALAHTVYDPAAIGPGHAIQVVINGATRATLRWPYASQHITDIKLHVPGLFGGSDITFNLDVSIS